MSDIDDLIAQIPIGQIAAKLGIRSIPTLFIYKDGQKVDQLVGAKPKGDLQRWISTSAAPVA